MSKLRPGSRTQQLDAFIRESAEACKLKDWTEFTRELQVPAAFAVALFTNRPEMMRLVEPVDLKAVEVKALYAVIATLIETNAALRTHAEQLGAMTRNWADAFTQLEAVGRKIEKFAQYKPLIDDEDPELTDLTRRLDGDGTDNRQEAR